MEELTEGAKLERNKTTTSMIVVFVQTARYLTTDSITRVTELKLL